MDAFIKIGLFVLAELLAILDDSFQACSDIRAALVKEFRKQGIQIPHQTVTVYTAEG